MHDSLEFFFFFLCLDLSFNKRKNVRLEIILIKILVSTKHGKFVIIFVSLSYIKAAKTAVWESPCREFCRTHTGM